MTFNRVAERMIQTLTRRARTMLADAGLTARLWPQAVKYSAYLYNRLPHRTTGEVPITRLNKHLRVVSPIYSELRIFGSKAYYVDAPDNTSIPKTRKKISPNGHECIYLGQDDVTVTLYCMNRRQLIDAPRTFLVNEGTFVDEDTLLEHDLSNTTDEFDLILQPDISGHDDDYEPPDLRPPSGERSADPPMDVIDDLEGESKFSDMSEDDENDFGDDIENQSEEVESRHMSSSLRSLTSDHQLPYVRVDSYEQLEASGESETPIDEVSLLAQEEMKALMPPTDVPETFEEAWAIPEWRESIEREWECLIKNETWRTPQMDAMICNIVGCKWVFKIKRDQHGRIVKYKSRLVAQGFTQKLGLDYDETYAPVATKRSLRCFLAHAAKYELEMEQMDIETAFLSGDIDRPIFMKAPKGFEHLTGPVVELLRSIYGLKQAPRIFYLKLEKVLLQMGFKQSRVDPCIYLKGDIRLLVYVDDLLVASPDLNDIEMVYAELSKEFTVVRMGKPRYLLGCEIEYTEDGFILKQSQYIRDLCKAYHCEHAKCPRTPMEAKLELYLDKTAEVVNAPYGSLLGGLLYIACCTRPDIATAVSILGQVSSHPTATHWKYLKRVLKYLKGTIDHGLKFAYGDQKGLEGYCDANWGGCLSTSRSRSGIVCCYNMTPVLWKSQKQSCVSLSSCEAEYYSISCGAKDILETNYLVSELTSGEPYCEEKLDPVLIYEDNQSCIKALKNDMVSPNLRHIRMRYHWIKEKIACEEILVKYVDTEHQLADGFSKCLGPLKFQAFMDQMVKCSQDLGSVESH